MANPADMRAQFRGYPTNVIFTEVYGHFACNCGELSDFEDCMLPAYHECPNCKRFFVVKFTVEEIKLGLRALNEASGWAALAKEIRDLQGGPD